MDVSSIFRRMAQKVAETSGNAGTNGANPSSMVSFNKLTNIYAILFNSGKRVSQAMGEGRSCH
jgi:hypothetical protein